MWKATGKSAVGQADPCDPRPKPGYQRRMRHLSLALCLALTGLSAQAEPLAWGHNTYGMPGLIDMPSALPFEDGELSFTTSYFADQTRHSLSFQIAPRLTGSFRYALLYGI